MKVDSSLSLFRRILLRSVATLGIVAAVSMSWWMRVENAREKDDLPVVALGTAIDLGRTTLTPLSLALDGNDDGQRRLVLRARVENRTGETQAGVFGFPPRPPQIGSGDLELGQPEIVLDRDGEQLAHLQPRMPEDVSVIWEVPSEWQPGQLSMTFFRQTFKLRDNLYGQANWLSFEPSARLVVARDETS
jgi:hypothetical protein